MNKFFSSSLFSQIDMNYESIKAYLRMDKNSTNQERDERVEEILFEVKSPKHIVRFIVLVISLFILA